MVTTSRPVIDAVEETAFLVSRTALLLPDISSNVISAMIDETMR